MAVAASSPEKCCLHLQQSLDTIAGENDPGSIRESFGFIEALKSARNTRGFTAVEANAFPGKAKPQAGGGAANRPRLEIEYLKPVARTAATSKLGLCGDQAASTDPYGYLDVTVDNTAALGGDFSKNDFDELCHGPSERLAIDVRNTAHDILRAINIQMITEAYAVVGNYVDGDDSGAALTQKAIPLINGAGHVNPAAMAAVKSQFRRMHTQTPPIVVGGDILGIWTDTRVMGGLGANAIAASEDPRAIVAGADVYLDYDVDPTIQALESDSVSRMIAWTPGVWQMLEWYDYVGYKAEIGKEDYIETTIEIDGYTFDWSLNYDKCTHQWSYELSKSYDLFYIPDVAFAGDSTVWDWNRRLVFQVSCGDFACANYHL